MIKIICDKCGKEITNLSNKINLKKKNGVEIYKKHICADCICDALKIKVDDDDVKFSNEE